MDRKKLLRTLTYLVSFIFLVNFLATKLHWYSAIWWFDMPMHFLGGLWIGLLAIYLFWSKINSSGKFFSNTLVILFSILLIGSGWEVFEALVNEVIIENPFDYLDTFSDILFDLAGGSAAILYLLVSIMPQSKNTVQYKS